jgi:hypothetical protein
MKADSDGVIAALDGVPLSVDPARLARLSRDSFSVSPLLREALAGRTASLRCQGPAAAHASQTE